MDNEIGEEYLTPEEVVALTKGTVSKHQLAQRRYLGQTPKWLAPTPRRILYRRSDVIAWLEGSERTRTDEPVSA